MKIDVFSLEGKMSKIAVVNSSSFGKYFPEHVARLEKIGTVDFFTFPIDTSGNVK